MYIYIISNNTGLLYQNKPLNKSVNRNVKILLYGKQEDTCGMVRHCVGKRQQTFPSFGIHKKRRKKWTKKPNGGTQKSVGNSNNYNVYLVNTPWIGKIRDVKQKVGQHSFIYSSYRIICWKNKEKNTKKNTYI